MTRLVIMLAWCGMMSIISACDDYPIDEDGLLITERTDCYVASFELLGEDHHSVINTVSVDNSTCVVTVEVLYGTNLKKLWPQFSLANDCVLSPKIEGWIDFSDLSHPRRWTVVSGNREVRKEYTVRITMQQPT